MIIDKKGCLKKDLKIMKHCMSCWKEHEKEGLFCSKECKTWWNKIIKPEEEYAELCKQLES